MPKLPSIKPKDLIKKFQNFGYEKDRQRGSHVILYHREWKKRIVIPLHVRDLPTGTLHAIIKQSGVAKSEFKKS